MHRCRARAGDSRTLAERSRTAEGYTYAVRPTTSGTPAFHEAEERPPLMSGADASRESAGRGNQIRHILSVVLALNLAVAGAKLGYGFVSGSVAMSADGFHSLLDGFANVVGIVGIAVAARPPDREHHFGHGRYETLASMAIGALMAVGVLEIVQSAVGRWQAGETPQVTRLSFGSDARHDGGQRRGDDLGAPRRAQTAERPAGGGRAPHRIGRARLGGGHPGADRGADRACRAPTPRSRWSSPAWWRGRPGESCARHRLCLPMPRRTSSPGRCWRRSSTAPGAITAHNLRVRSSGGRNWVEVHVTVDPELTVKQAHEVATGVESAIRDEVGPETQAIVHVEPAEPPHTRPDPIFGHEY